MGGKSPFVSLFEFVATLDPSPYYCIETALKFRRDACGGEAEIMKYCWGLSNEGGRRVADLLGTDVMDNQERSLSQSAFSNVRLPLTVGYGKGEVPEADKSRVMFWLAARLLDDHDTYVAFYFHAGSFWVRLSGQIYLELDDFLNGAQALKKLCERVRDKEYLQAGG